MRTPQYGRSLRIVWRIHRWIFTSSGGRLGAHAFGQSALLLHTVGHKSGQPRTNMLYYYPDGENFVVMASNAGREHHPAWFLNLMAAPQTNIQIGRKNIDVTAHEAQGEDRERLWKMVTDALDDYAIYQSRTTRQIPVVVLTPQAME